MDKVLDRDKNTVCVFVRKYVCGLTIDYWKKKVYVVIEVGLCRKTQVGIFVCLHSMLVPEGPERLVLGHQGVLYCPSCREDVG